MSGLEEKNYMGKGYINTQNTDISTSRKNWADSLKIRLQNFSNTLNCGCDIQLGQCLKSTTTFQSYSTFKTLC